MVTHSVGRALGYLRRPQDLVLAARIGWFVLRAPADLQDREVTHFLTRLRRARRPRAADPAIAARRVARIRGAVLGLPSLRRRNTCYVRALTLYRFVDAGGRDLRFHLAVEERADPADRLRGHAWVTVDGAPLEEGPDTIGRPLREVELGPIG